MKKKNIKALKFGSFFINLIHLFLRNKIEMHTNKIVPFIESANKKSSTVWTCLNELTSWLIRFSFSLYFAYNAIRFKNDFEKKMLDLKKKEKKFTRAHVRLRKHTSL